MNKAAIKTYAVWARNELISRVSQKAYEYGITKENVIDANSDSVNGRLLSSLEKKQRQELIKEISNKGYEQVMEEAAYTWFNRFIALRFMEVNNYLPNKVRLFTNGNNEFEPQILQEALNVDLDSLDKNKVYELINNNNNDELYKLLLLATCNDMSKYLPGMFTTIEEFKVLLFPDNLLNKNSVLGKLVLDIPEDDWHDQVQIIGWMYQFYNIEPKDKANSKKSNDKIKKEEIPAVTQLFTPDWIVRYMCENSLGRLWLDGHNNSEIKSKWKYYLDETEQEKEIQEQLNIIKKEHAIYLPEQIKFIDPCMGSGHILVYAFDIFMQIYVSEGWTEREAAKSILENNLYGLDIDDRAYQLSYFSLMMKARQYSRKILNDNVTLNIMSIKESHNTSENVLNKFSDLKPLAEKVLHTFSNAKELGSIINLDINDEELIKLNEKLDEIDSMTDYGSLVDQIESMEVIETFTPLIKQAKILCQKYEILVTNPPYRPVSDLSYVVQEYANKHYPNSKTDLFSVFMEKAELLTKPKSYFAMINMHSWMFLSSYESLRERLLESNAIINMIHLGARAFEEISGEVVQTTSFVMLKKENIGYKGVYSRLVDYNSQSTKENAFLNKLNVCYFNQNDFSKIPGYRIAYWANNQIINTFKNSKKLIDVAKPKSGIMTGDDSKFVRDWVEIDITKMEINESNIDALNKYKWFPVTRGGSYRKWYGNLGSIVNLENDAKEIKNNGKTYRLRDKAYYFKNGFSWTMITTKNLSMRVIPKGVLFGNGGPSVFIDDYYYYLALLNSVIINKLISFMNPTMNVVIEDIQNLPIKIGKEKEINNLSKECIRISKDDWDSFETSWDFKKHPFMNYVAKNKNERLIINSCGDTGYSKPIEYSYNNWSIECDKRFELLKQNEQELNKLFIDIYDLKNELYPEIEDKDISVRKAELNRDIKSFISYAVGCMFGRYSLDHEGLAYAGGDWDDSKYSTYIPDADNIIPICDDEYFEDDITGKFIKFVETVYGKEPLEDNLTFIAEALGKNGNPRKAIREYFINDFFTDHCNTYQVTGSGKRPIYWLFDSGKKNGFKALIYIHRYTPDLIAKMRTDYVHEQQSRYRTQISLLENQINNSSSTNEKIQIEKQLNKYKEQANELKIYEEKIHHWADKMEPMDLDDGVKANYAKFQELLTKIK